MSVLRLEDAGDTGIEVVGGKAFNLGLLLGWGERVPSGVVVTVDESLRYWEHVFGPGALRPNMTPALLAEEVRRAFLVSRESYKRLDMLADAINEVNPSMGQHAVAVRSSAVLEDAPNAAAAGQHDSFLGILGIPAICEAILLCWASEWTERAQVYRATGGIGSARRGMGVVVQLLVPARIAGVVFSEDPIFGSEYVLIEAVAGFGDSLVSGQVTPERVRLQRNSLRVTEREGTTMGVPELLTSAEIEAVAQMALRIEGRFGVPQDIEWAFDAHRLHVIQSRPITGLGRKA